jgi:hypothetical protein
MVGEFSSKVGPILDQYFNEVGKHVVQKFVAAIGFIPTTAIGFLAPRGQIRKKSPAVPRDIVLEGHRRTWNVVRIVCLPMARHYIACLQVYVQC